MEKEQNSCSDLSVAVAEYLPGRAVDDHVESNQDDDNFNSDEVRYEIGDKVRTVSGFVAVIESESSSGLYHPRYIKGDIMFIPANSRT